MVRRYRIPTLWQEMARLQRDVNRFFPNAPGGRVVSASAYPAVNVWAGEEGQVITAELPGLSADDIEISLVGDELTLSGERAAPDVAEGAQVHRRERGVGSFTRTIQLPFAVDAEKAEASFEHGMLQIRLPRAQADLPRKVAVKGS
jgi:HSP20 family protein